MVSVRPVLHDRELLFIPRRTVVGRSESGAAGDFGELCHHHHRREASFERKDHLGALGRHPAGLHRCRAHLAALMLSLTTIIGLLLAACTLAATAFYLLSLIAAYRFFSLSSEKKNKETQRFCVSV